MKNVSDKIKIVLTTLDVDMPKSFGFVLTSIIHRIWNFSNCYMIKDFGYDRNIKGNYIRII